MRFVSRFPLVLLTALALCLPAAQPALAQCVSLTTLGSASTQNFDTLSNVAASTTNNLTITGWFLTESGGGARDNEQYAVDTGGSTTGDMYSYGAAASTERALGELRSGTLIPIFGACYTNNTGATIARLDVAYTGEEWRLGTAARTDQISFEYSTNATDLVTGTWTNHAALNFVTPDTVTAGAKNGNAAADRTALSSMIPGFSIANGATFWIRWTDTDATGADDGLAVDDFSLTPQGAVVQPNLTINDVSLNEGNAGTTSFTFTVSLSAPAGAGGVTFDIATADGTAVQPGDYTQKSLTGQTIPAGSSTYSFTVLVNGDTTPEANETFLVNVTNVTGAAVTDGQGQGTIQNDDAAPNLTINDVSLNEGNAGTTTFTFTVSLSAPAPAGGVTFDIATANSSAVAPGDYTTKSLTGQTIPAGSSTYTFDVLVNGDTTPETDEIFFVNVTNITNAIGVDTQGQGTIVNDDITFIHDVQGNGAATPIPGATVTVEGVVVGDFQAGDQLQGFFLQEEDADADADPATSEGIFVFCNTCPTPVAEGQRVRVTGVVSEFNGMTEITSSTAPSVVVTNAGNNLAQATPAPIDLPVVGDVNAFYEAREGMRVTFVDTLTVAEYFEMARFGHIELFEGGRPRQFTEMSPPNAAGLTAHLDNLDRRRVVLDDDDNNQNSSLTPFQPDGLQFVFHPQANGGLSVGTQGTDFFRGGDLVNGLTGVLHWSFPGVVPDTWRIRPTAATPAAFTVANPRPAAPPAVGGAIRAVGMNLLNYFTTIDTTSSNNAGPCGPSGTLDCRGADSVAELNRQRERASIVICTLNAHVYGFMELENTTATGAITDLLGAVNARCGGANPYAFVNTGGTLGTDAIRVAIIYRSGILSPVGPALVDLDPVHNRPPTAQTFDVVDPANPAFGERFTVVANHSKSKGCPGTGADADAGDGASCFNGTRTAQASRLLTWVNGTVVPAAGDPDVLMVGDFNAYAMETPTTTLTAGGYTDLESALLGPSAYSYLFDGQLGHLDYAFSSASLTPQVTGVAPWHINADENPLFDYNDEVRDTGEAAFEEKPDGSALVPPRVLFQPASPYRASDHDPVLVGLFQIADLSVTKVDTPDPVTAGTNLTYTITVSNAGPDAATSASWSDTLPAGTAFVSLPAVAGWSCTTPAVGAGGTVSCSNPSFGVGSAVFTLTVAVAPTVTAGTVLTNTATATSTAGDGNAGNDSGTATTTVGASADLSVTKVDTPDPVTAGTNLTYTITVTNAGPSNAATVSLSDTLPAGTAFVSLSSPGGWSCMTPAVGAGGTVSCSFASLPAGSAVFTLTVAVAPGTAAGSVLSNTATVSSATADPTPGNDSGTATTTVGASADLSVTKTDAFDPTAGGVNMTYTITVTNAGPSNATTVSLSDPLPAGTTFLSLSSPGGWSCTTPAVGAGGTVTCTNASLAVGSAVFTLTVAVAPSTTGTISNTATVSSATADPVPGNNSATETTLVSSAADMSVTKIDTPDPVTAGTNLVYTITVGNAGPSNAPMASLTDTLPAGTTFVSLSSPGGWSCTTPAVGAGGTVTCSNASMPPGSAVFTLTVLVGPAVPGGTVLSNTATVTAAASDLIQGNETATATTTVTGAASPASVSGTKTASGTFQPGSTVIYTVVLTNTGGTATGDNPGNELTDVLPAGLTLVSATATAGTAVANVGTNTVTWNGPLAAGASVTITINATIDAGVAPGTTISNQGSIAYDADNNGTNEASAVTDNPSTGAGGDATPIVVTGGPQPPAEIPTLDSVGLALLALLLAFGGAALLRRKQV
ncbi:MAG TPA: ExeM/NucH family extracellular endonuclease [Thermoanaerobaculia bacterium]|nr:ExeM/NucH family extracellular endonuclease [Thermoanaerobaculia bacterium]